MAEAPPTIVLCRPVGGLNDIFCQMQLCIRYGQDHGRLVYIDSESSPLAAPLQTYVQILPEHQGLIHNWDAAALARYGGASCLPAHVEGRLDQYRTRYVSGRNFVEEQTLQPISFDFRRSYRQQVLVHHQCGGGYLGVAALAYLRLQPELAGRIRERLAALPPAYAAVHVRHTDLRTDFARLFARLQAWLARHAGAGTLPLVLCSDSPVVRRAAAEFFPERTLIVPGQGVADERGEVPLHTRLWREGRLQDCVEQQIAALVDLFVLSRSRVLFFGDTAAGKPSGFSILAAQLARHPALGGRLLAAEAPPCRPVYLSGRRQRLSHRLKLAGADRRLAPLSAALRGG